MEIVEKLKYYVDCFKKKWARRFTPEDTMVPITVLEEAIDRLTAYECQQKLLEDHTNKPEVLRDIIVYGLGARELYHPVEGQFHPDNPPPPWDACDICGRKTCHRYKNGIQ